jgi:hypothetical protein
MQSALFRIFLIVLVICTFGRVSSAAASAPDTKNVASVPGDRWMEIDLYWFEQKDLSGSVNEFWQRFAPLYSDVEGYKGIVLNVGWTVNYIIEFSGDLQQKIALPVGSGQQPWVAETSALPGSTDDRVREWKQRFSTPLMVPRHGYGSWTYGDLKRLADLLRAGGEQRGIPGFKVATLCYAWTNAYGEIAPFAKRHPEAWTAWGTAAGDDPTVNLNSYFDPGKTLHADGGKFAALPKGIPEGMSVHTAFTAQWGALSKSVGLDGIMLRDSFGFPVPYARSGPLGPVMPSAEVIHRATADVSTMVREIKLANPAALTMMYSNAASAISDWRSNGLDLESVAKEGYLDIFVDQTWAGAWNEVGVRHDNFWNVPLLGWTYQLTYTLEHSAMLAGTKVRHYPLVETFDAWESWDVLHTVPQRLRWGIWMYSHTTAKTPHGLRLPEGTYISWANQGKRLLSEDDVQFLRTNINDARRDAATMSEVYGPTIVYSRDAMLYQADHAAPNYDIKEWTDEQVGTVIKWPVPILSITRIEWLPQVKSDLYVFGAPSHLPADQLNTIERLARSGQPMSFFGSSREGIDPSLLRLTGWSATPRTPDRPGKFQGMLGDLHLANTNNIPVKFPIQQRLTDASAAPDTTVYSVEHVPALVLNQSGSLNLSVWDPPTLLGRCCKPLREILGNSGAPYALAAATLTQQLASGKALRAATIDLDQTGTVAAWRTTDGRIHLLAGNLEEGLREDADHSRHISLQLPASWKELKWRSAWGPENFAVERGRFGIDLAPESSVMIDSNAF